MLSEIVSFAKTNPILTGAGGMAAGGFIMGHIKSLPNHAWSHFKNQFSIELTVWSEDQIFYQFDRWLAQHPSSKKRRRFFVANWWDEKLNDDAYGLSPGAGRHYLRHKSRWFVVNRIVEKGDDQKNPYSTARRKQSLTITTPGRDATPIIELLNEVLGERSTIKTTSVYLWNGMEPYMVGKRPAREMDTVYCDEAVKRAITEDVEQFLNSKPLYAYRGTPYRRGYMLTGPPGTGKTTMILAVAALTGRPVLIINASSVENDKELLAAVNSTNRDFVVVIEDIDSLPASESRETAERPKASLDVGKSGISLSGLLNALDGIGSSEGRIMFITSNTPDILDSALTRPGRIDATFHLGPAGEAEARAMYRRFYPEGDAQAFVEHIRPSLPMAQAELQNLLLTHPTFGK